MIPTEPVELATDHSWELHELHGSALQPIDHYELYCNEVRQPPERFELPGSDFVDKGQYLEVPQFSSRDAYDSPYRTANAGHTDWLPLGMGMNNATRIQVDEWVSSQEERREPGLVEWGFTEEGRSRDYIIDMNRTQVMFVRPLLAGRAASK